MDEVEVEELLEKEGWEVTCFSPFEIQNQEAESFAKNLGAKAVVDDIMQTKKFSRLHLIADAYKENIIDMKIFVEKIIETLES